MCKSKAKQEDAPADKTGKRYGWEVKHGCLGASLVVLSAFALFIAAIMMCKALCYIKTILGVNACRSSPPLPLYLSVEGTVLCGLLIVGSLALIALALRGMSGSIANMADAEAEVERKSIEARSRDYLRGQLQGTSDSDSAGASQAQPRNPSSGGSVELTFRAGAAGSFDGSTAN